jgi:tetratricopeptide (TPR) repeat protein
MKTIIISFLTLIILATESFGQEYEEYLLKANKSYESGDQDTAKELYLKAAEKGHAEALGYALEKLLFRANSLRLADPQKALDLYHEAKKAKPDLSLYDEENTVKVMKMCVEPKGFDAEQFMKKYGVEDEGEQNPDYHVWELAEEASRGGRFGKPDPELVLNLVIRGGAVPAEFMLAVEEVYANWKNGVVKEFNICDHVTSGSGQGYCAERADAEKEEEREIKLNALKEKLGGDAGQLLTRAYDSAVQFIESKASNEEGHGGTGRVAWIIDSEIEQKNQYLELIEKIHAGFIPVPENSFPKADQRLNEMYRHVLHELQKKTEEDDYPVTTDEIRAVQRLWIPYRDASVELFVHMNPSIDKNIWKSWLIEIRIKELKLMLELQN